MRMTLWKVDAVERYRLTFHAVHVQLGRIWDVQVPVTHGQDDDLSVDLGVAVVRFETARSATRMLADVHKTMAHANVGARFLGRLHECPAESTDVDRASVIMKERAVWSDDVREMTPAIPGIEPACQVAMLASDLAHLLGEIGRCGRAQDSVVEHQRAGVRQFDRFRQGITGILHAPYRFCAPSGKWIRKSGSRARCAFGRPGCVNHHHVSRRRKMNSGTGSGQSGADDQNDGLQIYIRLVRNRRLSALEYAIADGQALGPAPRRRLVRCGDNASASS